MKQSCEENPHQWKLHIIVEHVLLIKNEECMNTGLELSLSWNCPQPQELLQQRWESSTLNSAFHECLYRSRLESVLIHYHTILPFSSYSNYHLIHLSQWIASELASIQGVIEGEDEVLAYSLLFSWSSVINHRTFHHTLIHTT